MVKALHKAGIEVILDLVFNHTGEMDETGPIFNLRGLDNSIYYMLDPVTGAYEDFSGCGNTVNCNHPVARSLIMDALRYWVTEMHVDGFRFDLASILGRGQDGTVLANPPLLERIAAEPVLANTKLIAEAWDAAGLYQVGAFPNWVDGRNGTDGLGTTCGGLSEAISGWFRRWLRAWPATPICIKTVVAPLITA